MYSKLFARITESSLMEEPIDVRYTFVLMLAIADPEGYVIGTDIAIARRLNMPLVDFQKCISVLMRPDPNSNSKELDGRRIVHSDGDRGYRVVNFVNYRNLKSPEDRRDYMRNYMRKRREKQTESAEHNFGQRVTDSVNNVNNPLAMLRHEDAEDIRVITPQAATHSQEPTAGQQISQEADGRLKLDGTPTPPNRRRRANRSAQGNGHFVPPTIDQVAAYCREKGYTIDPEAFEAYHAARGWRYKTGLPMVDWKKAVVTFQKNEAKFGVAKNHRPPVDRVCRSAEEYLREKVKYERE